MQVKSRIMFHVLLNRFHAKAQLKFLKALPAKTAKELGEIKVDADDASPLLLQPTSLIEKIHYSWFIPSFEKLPKAILPSVLASLPHRHAIGLSKRTGYAISEKVPSQPVKTFLINTLYTHFGRKEILPLLFLPTTSLSVLLTLAKEELIKVINFLGLYDLAGGIRKILDQKTVKNIYAALSVDQQRFLRSCLNYKEKFTLPPLGLDQWNGDPKKLDQLLHKRGMLRLGRALSGHHPDFAWHVVHILDAGRGEALLKYCQKEATPDVSEVFTNQTIKVINYINKKS